MLPGLAIGHSAAHISAAQSFFLAGLFPEDLDFQAQAPEALQFLSPPLVVNGEEEGAI